MMNAFPRVKSTTTVLVAFVFGAGSALANGIYMDIEREDGSAINGGSQITGYKDQIILTELSQSLWADQTGCGCCSATLSASKKPDGSSIELYRAALTGEEFGQVTISFVEGQETGKPEKYLEMTLDGASLTTMDASFSGSAQWSGRSEHLTIGFSGITWTSWNGGEKQVQQWEAPKDPEADKDECS